VGDVDLGVGGPPRQPLCGHRVIARSLLGFYGPASRTTLVSEPVNGHPGVVAFRDRQLVGIVHLKARGGIICDLHAIADPAKLAFVQLQLGPAHRSH
jgi:hypothetical protein